MHTGLGEYVDVAENAREDVFRLLAAATVCPHPGVAAMFKQHAKHSAFGLGQLHQLGGNLGET